MTPDSLKSFFKPYSKALADFEPTAVKAVMDDLFAPDATFKVFKPYGQLYGPDAIFEQ